MTKKELIEQLSNLKDDDKIMFYVMDCEYELDGYDIGEAIFKSIRDGYIMLRTNYWEGKYEL